MLRALVVLSLIIAPGPGPAPPQERWPNPWIVVRPAGVYLFPQYGGFGGLFPAERLRAAVRELPADVWRDGRVVALEEMAFLPADEERLAQNVAKTVAILAELDIAVHRRPRAAATVEHAEMIERENGMGSFPPRLLEEALAASHQAAAAAPTSQRTLVYRVRLLEIKARRTTDRRRRAALRQEAENLWRRAVALRLAPQTPAPPGAPDLSAAIFGESFKDTVRRLRAIEDTRRLYPRPVSYWSLDPVYANAPAAAPLGHIVIGPDGVVMNAEMIRGERQVERAVLEAARLRFFTPPLVNERAVAWVQLIAFPAKAP
ncbi:MAG TPA: hypothetical protein VFK57_11220 [Vicinamibacterales bacterium]|nr:hypothetical protein [Vicinamibacterales bacterium]